MKIAKCSARGIWGKILQISFSIKDKCRFPTMTSLVHRIEYCFKVSSLSENDMLFIILEPYETHGEK